jgi:Cu/Ag efflux protein CusF
MRRNIAVLFLASIAAGLPALAQTPPAKPSTAPSSTAAADDSVEGEVRKVDKDAKKITLKHGPIPNLEMTGMTMVFRVKDPAMLDAVKVGDKVRFKADKVQGAITITEIKPAG